MKKGDIISIDYELWILNKENPEEKELLDTSSEELAKEKELFDEQHHYGPEDFIVGKGKPFRVVDESFLEAEEEKEVELQIEPVDAYGERDIHKIRFCKRDELEPAEKEGGIFRGARVKLHQSEEGLGDGQVLVTTGRRINVDFNHPLAGKSILYKYTIRKVYRDINEILTNLFQSYFPRVTEVVHTISEDGSEIRIQLPDSCKVDNNWMIAKLFIVTTLRETQDFKTIIFEELYETKEEETEESEAEVTVDVAEAETTKTPEEGEAAPEDAKKEQSEESSKDAPKEQIEEPSKE